VGRGTVGGLRGVGSERGESKKTSVRNCPTRVAEQGWNRKEVQKELEAKF